LPAISVVMPVYNRAGTVRTAVDSVLAQDFADFELLVIDDGSQDGTADVIDSVGDPRIRCLRQPQNRGGNAARNRGIREAQSPLICFLDSDDEFLPHKLGFLVDFFDRHPGIDALADSFRLIYPPETGKPPADRPNPELWTSAEVEQAVFSRRLYKATPALSARRKVLEDIGLFDETLKRRQDMDLILRLTRSARCAATPEVLWTKRWSADSISAKQNTFATAMIEMCERHPDYLTRPEFRIGLSRDMARHFLRLVGTGHGLTAAKDFRRCASFFGWGQTARLTGAGLVEMARRLVTRRAA
jgi:glycosyltransferase involved in cell wall biosynthesis